MHYILLKLFLFLLAPAMLQTPVYSFLHVLFYFYSSLFVFILVS